MCGQLASKQSWGLLGALLQQCAASLAATAAACSTHGGDTLPAQPPAPSATTLPPHPGLPFHAACCWVPAALTACCEAAQLGGGKEGLAMSTTAGASAASAAALEPVRQALPALLTSTLALLWAQSAQVRGVTLRALLPSAMAAAKALGGSHAQRLRPGAPLLPGAVVGDQSKSEAPVACACMAACKCAGPEHTSWVAGQVQHACTGMMAAPGTARRAALAALVQLSPLMPRLEDDDLLAVADDPASASSGSASGQQLLLRHLRSCLVSGRRPCTRPHPWHCVLPAGPGWLVPTPRTHTFGNDAQLAAHTVRGHARVLVPCWPQAGADALDRKRAAHLLQRLLPEPLASSPPWQAWFGLQGILEEFALHLIKPAWVQHVSAIVGTAPAWDGRTTAVAA